jgi:hypothetical protein
MQGNFLSNDSEAVDVVAVATDDVDDKDEEVDAEDGEDVDKQEANEASIPCNLSLASSKTFIREVIP